MEGISDELRVADLAFQKDATVAAPGKLAYAMGATHPWRLGSRRKECSSL